MDYAGTIMKAAKLDAVDRQKTENLSRRAEGLPGNVPPHVGFAKSSAGLVKVHFVEAQSSRRLQRHATRTTWYLDGKRLAGARLSEILNAEAS